MLTWITENQELLIALFGAGGAGAVLLAGLFKARKKPTQPTEETARPFVRATSTGCGTAVAHAGNGDVHIRVNEAVDQDTLGVLAKSLGLSLEMSTRFLRALDGAGLSVSAGLAVAELLGSVEGCDDQTDLGKKKRALIGALQTDDQAQAGSVLFSVLQHGDGRLDQQN